MKSGAWISSWRRWSSNTVGVGLVLLLVMASLPLPRVAQAQTTVNFNNILRATVFITSVYDVPGGRAASCIGSGTLISADGLILTNAHNVVDGERCRVEDIAISLTVRLNEPPVPTYYAELVDYDMGLDLAVLRIVRELDGRIIEPGDLRLPFVELGDSAELALDDTVVVFGYPGMGNDAVTFARGTVLGFTAEPRGGDRAWLKTSATILGTMSGGGAYDQQGRLIGIPTTAPVSSAEAALDCRSVQDTTGDGQVDGNDDCIPVGGFINALRPVALAQGIIRGAQLGIQHGGHTYSQDAGSVPGGEPRFGDIHFSPSVNAAGMPTTFVTQMPAGTNSLYLFFDYENMRPGITYELRTTINGIPNPVFSLSPALWSGGERGLWYIGTAGQPWPNGVYEFTLLIEGLPAGSARITIGGSQPDTPAFADVVFGLLDFQGNVLGSGYVLPTGSVANARFIYRNMTPSLPWTEVWYYEGVEIRRNTETWSEGPGGSMTVSIRSEGGLAPGRYRLELWIGEDVMVLADFVIAGAQEGAFAQVFENVRFADAMQDGAPSGTISQRFPEPVPALYAFVDWRLLSAGTPWTYRWLVDGDLLFERTEYWRGPESGANLWFALGAEALVPDASYTLEISLADLLLVSETVEVGLGQLRATQDDSTQGVRVYGTVTDAVTGEGIPGVMFIVLEAEYGVEDFVWNENQILGMSLTDSRGQFEITRLLPYDDFYSVVVIADGYLPVAADGIYLDPENPPPDNELALSLALNRDLTP